MGFTVTTDVMAGPEHPFAVGMIVYVTVDGSGVVLTKVWAMEFPLESDAPVTLPAGATTTVQTNVVPVTVLVRAMDVVLPEQKVCEVGVEVANGVGWTVTGVLDEARQPLASVTVTVYVPEAAGSAFAILGF